ncbi:hypothetical protein DFH07DRAFT_1012030 [Mycena maculata]|uniref:Uncharacterized protein n=1 Tax=Mycena maculata TaxID=230809 RepID=A0AAD7JND0_9AGAR|nr:hypothetical protein DFH07DRAFT_1012030 [Mycena maculata]
MSSEDTYLPSSPSTVYSQALDYEQSQHAQEIRETREAEMSTEELEAAAEERRLKRVRLGLESPNYKKEPFLSPLESPVQTPRASAVKSTQKNSRDFGALGLLNSQTDSQEAIDALIERTHNDTLIQQTRNADFNFTSQDVLDQLDHRRQPVVYDDEISDGPESYDELLARCDRAETERDEALTQLIRTQQALGGAQDELKALRDGCRHAYEEIKAAESRAEVQFASWKEAAESLVNLADPYVN